MSYTDTLLTQVCRHEETIPASDLYPLDVDDGDRDLPRQHRAGAAASGVGLHGDVRGRPYRRLCRCRGRPSGAVCSGRARLRLPPALLLPAARHRLGLVRRHRLHPARLTGRGTYGERWRSVGYGDIQ